MRFRSRLWSFICRGILVAVWISVIAVWPATRAGAQSWEQVVAAAEREGKVSIMLPIATVYREMIEGFKAKFPKIQLEYISGFGRDLAPRLLSERRAGRKLLDVYVGGVVTLHRLKRSGVIADLRPALLLPDATDDRLWHGGLEYGFTDIEKRYVYTFTYTVTDLFTVNRSFIPASQLSHPRELPDPKFKGKIVWEDPRTAGPGQDNLTIMLHSYGEDFVRKVLTEQDVVFTRDARQLGNWVLGGRHPIGVNLRANVLAGYLESGLGKDLVEVRDPKLQYINASVNCVALVEGAPHPNAAKVFINWLFSKEPQEILATKGLQNSRRVGVPPGEPKSFPDPARLTDYFRQNEEWDETREKAQNLAKALIK